MCVQHGLNVGYPYLGLHRFAHLRPTWALCGLPVCGFALVLPMCVRHELYVGCPYVDLHRLPVWDPDGLYVDSLYVVLRLFWLCVSDVGFMDMCTRAFFARTYQKSLCKTSVEIHYPRMIHKMPLCTLNNCTYTDLTIIVHTEENTCAGVLTHFKY